jgi:hypothetical protein
MNVPNKLECLSMASFFQLSLMFVSKATAYPSGATFRAPLLSRLIALPASTRQGWDNHSSLFGTFINYDRKKFYNIRQWSQML